MEITVEPSKTYAVTTSGSCTVTDADGLELCTASSGSQAFFVATTPTVTVSDDGAKVNRATFNYALAVAGLLGGGSDKLPEGYTRLKFLESTGTQVIVLPVNKNNPKSLFMSTEVQFTALPAINNGMQEGQNSRFQWGLWSSASFTEAFASVNNASGNLSFGKVGEQWNSWTTCTIGYDAPYHRWGTWGAFRAEDEGAIGPPNIPNFVLFGVERYGWFGFFQKVRKKRFVLKADGVTLYRLIPALAPDGTPCMYDRVSKRAFKNDGSGQFIAGMTLSQVRGLRLPAGGGQLTLSLPHEASIDRLAQAALEQARANGWELTLQYAEDDVPAGYRRLEFLESTGTQYIDTRYVPQIGDALSIANLTLNNEQGSIFISTNNGNDPKLILTNAASLYYKYFSSGKAPALGRRKITPNSRLYVDGEGCLFVNGKMEVQVTAQGGVTRTLLFAYVAAMTWGQITISRNGQLQLDLIPCIAPNGKLGMYNRVDGTLKENAGSGAFIAGLATVDDVRKLWLPETGGALTVSVPADTPDSAVEQLSSNNPTWQIAIQYRTDDNEN